MLCGTSVKECSGLIWLNYMGNTGNGQTPFSIEYKTTKSELKPGQSLYKYEPKYCNKMYKGTKCSCQDCEASCTNIPTIPPAHNETLVFGIFEQSLFSVVVIFGIFVVFFLSAVILFGIVSFALGKRLDNNNNERKALINKEEADEIFDRKYGLTKPECGYCSIGNYFDYFLRSCFYHWGSFVARYPWLILIVGAVIITPLCFGIFLMKITTDPVKLWSSPDSQARHEKDYFDEHFGPFYRTEMLIFTSENVSSHNQTIYQSVSEEGITVEFSHMFQKDILVEVGFIFIK